MDNRTTTDEGYVYLLFSYSTQRYCTIATGSRRLSVADLAGINPPLTLIREYPIPYSESSAILAQLKDDLRGYKCAEGWYSADDDSTIKGTFDRSVIGISQKQQLQELFRS